MADGFIGGFEAKYHYNYWRPATAIRETVDATWMNNLPTPPVPDYPSTHTVLGAAAAAVLARFFETDYVTLMTSGAPSRVSRDGSGRSPKPRRRTARRESSRASTSRRRSRPATNRAIGSARMCSNSC